MAMTTSDFPALLRPGLNAIIGLSKTYDYQYKKIYTTYNSDKYQEIDVEMKSLGFADIVEQGAPAPSDTMGQRILTNYLHKRVQQSFIVTQIAMRDNLYKNSFPQEAKALRVSLEATKETLAANLLNQAFNAAAPIGDGQPLCSANHPIDGGVYANTFGAGAPLVDLSEGGLEAALIGIASYRMQSGILCNTMPTTIVVPKEQQFNISRLLNSTNRIDTGNNDINAIQHDSYIPKGYTVNNYLLSPSAYFIMTDAENAFKHFQRDPVETKTYMEPSTDNTVCKASERYSFGCSNARGVFGSQGV